MCAYTVLRMLKQRVGGEAFLFVRRRGQGRNPRYERGEKEGLLSQSSSLYRTCLHVGTLLSGGFVFFATTTTAHT